MFLEQFGSRNEAANGATHEALQVFAFVVVVVIAAAGHCSALFTFAVRSRRGRAAVEVNEEEETAVELIAAVVFFLLLLF